MLRIISEKYAQHNKPLYYVFINFKTLFYRVWHKALWSAMKIVNITLILIESIQNLYSKAESAVYLKFESGSDNNLIETRLLTFTNTLHHHARKNNE